MKKVLIFIEDGFEEVEALAPVDLLRRAGAEVILATGKPGGQVTGRNAITVMCDAQYADLQNTDFDLIIIPGGMGGVEAVSKSNFAVNLIQSQTRRNKLVGAICAAPLVLKSAGVLHNKTITSYPSVKTELDDITNYLDERVVVDGSLITSRGPGTAVEFGLKLIEKLYGPQKAEEIKMQVVA